MGIGHTPPPNMTNQELYLFLGFLTVLVIGLTLFGFKKFLDWSKRDAVGRAEEQEAVEPSDGSEPTDSHPH